MINKDIKIFLAGDRSPIAKDLKNILKSNGYDNIVGCNTDNLDLRDCKAVGNFFMEQKPEIVFIFAAEKPDKNPKIQSTEPFTIFSDNFFIAYNVMNACVKNDVNRVIYFGSDSALPCYSDGREVDEDSLFTAPIKKNFEAYAVSKIIGIKLCQYLNVQTKSRKFVALSPCNIYGNDVSTGLLSFLIKDFIEAKMNNLPTVQVWGGGELKYRFINSKDVAEAAYFAMQNLFEDPHYIIASENQITKRDLVKIIADKIDYKGEVIFDSSKDISQSVNASPKKFMSKGWRPKISLEDGIEDMIKSQMRKVNFK